MKLFVFIWLNVLVFLVWTKTAILLFIQGQNLSRWKNVFKKHTHVAKNRSTFLFHSNLFSHLVLCLSICLIFFFHFVHHVSRCWSDKTSWKENIAFNILFFLEICRDVSKQLAMTDEFVDLKQHKTFYYLLSIPNWTTADFWQWEELPAKQKPK